MLPGVWSAPVVELELDADERARFGGFGFKYGSFNYENPCARVGEENTAVTGTRRRIVNGLCTKGMLTRGLVYMSRKGDARHFPEDVKGLKFRIQASDVLEAQFRALGANPRSYPRPDAPSSAVATRSRVAASPGSSKA